MKTLHGVYENTTIALANNSLYLHTIETFAGKVKLTSEVCSFENDEKEV